MNRPDRSRGAALVIAMLVAALAATVAVSLASSQQQWFATVSQRAEQVQAQALAQAGIQWARQIMFEDARGDARGGKTDHLGEPWALPLPATPIENGSIEGRIVDAQGMLNVNNLAPEPGTGNDGSIAQQQFQRLFAGLGLPVGSVNAIADWIDADGATRPNGAEDGWYASQPARMLAANGQVMRTSELAVVRGLSPETVASLATYLVALPASDTKLNVNTAPAPVLASVLEGVEAGSIPAIIADRAKKPYRDLGDFRSRLPSGATVANEGALTVSSDYFLVSVRAKQGNTQAQARALIKRQPDKWPTVIWQTIE